MPAADLTIVQALWTKLKATLLEKGATEEVGIQFPTFGPVDHSKLSHICSIFVDVNNSFTLQGLLTCQRFISEQVCEADGSIKLETTGFFLFREGYHHSHFFQRRPFLLKAIS